MFYYKCAVWLCKIVFSLKKIYEEFSEVTVPLLDPLPLDLAHI